MIVHQTSGLAAESHPKYPRYPHVPALPSVSLLDVIGAPSLENFYFVGEAWAHTVGAFAGEGAMLLDIGCGAGRTARFLALRRDVRYLGFDIVHASIAWSREHIAARTGGRFRFEHMDVHSAHYNAAGRMAPEQATFPCAGASVDVAFAASLFTHLLEPAARRYLDEAARCLRPGGLLLASIHVEPAPGMEFSGTEDRIDMTPDYFARLAAASGLRLQESLGSLCGQETLVFRK